MLYTPWISDIDKAHQKIGFSSERKFFENIRQLSHVYIAVIAYLLKGRYGKDVWNSTQEIFKAE